MDVNDDAWRLESRGAPATIASKLAPTEGRCWSFEWDQARLLLTTSYTSADNSPEPRIRSSSAFISA